MAMYSKLLNQNDIVYFDKEDFAGLGEPVFFVEGRSMEDVTLPDADVKALFVRVVCKENETLDNIKALGKKLSTKFPSAEVKWALGTGKERLQVLGI